MEDKINNILTKLREVCPDDLPIDEVDDSRMYDPCAYCHYFIGEETDKDAICLTDIKDILEDILHKYNVNKQAYDDLAQKYQDECRGREYDYCYPEHLSEFLQKYCLIK